MILNKLPSPQQKLIVEAVTSKQITWASTSNPTQNGSFDISKTGYTPIGIVGYSILGSLSSYVYLSELRVYQNTCVYNARMQATPSSVTQNTMTVYVLYQKN